MENSRKIAVIGGANVDIKGVSNHEFRIGSSNPGTVYKAAGGVARNVAENLARVLLPVTLYTVIGADHEGKWLLEVTRNAGVDIDSIDILENNRTGIYLSILNNQKEQVGSIAEMEIMESLNRVALEKHITKILDAKMVFVDTNLPEDTLEYLFMKLKSKEISIIVDPVSVRKANKIKKYLNQIDLITPNKEEAEILTGISITSQQKLEMAVIRLLELGVKQVVLTLGKDGVFIASQEEKYILPSPTIHVLDTTGAGDAFTAGVMYGLYHQYHLFDASKYGHSLAAITLSCEESVASNLTREWLEDNKKELFANEK